MNEENSKYIQAIEELNREKRALYNSSIYRKGKSDFNRKKLLSSFDWKAILKQLRVRKVVRQINERYPDLTKENIVPGKIYMENYQEPRIAAYTCIVGKYDEASVPLLKFANMDVYLFADHPENYDRYRDAYIIRPMPEKTKGMDTISANRYVKFHPAEVLTGYDYSIYLDGNIRIISDIRRFICHINPRTGIAMHKHRQRDCVYEEAEVCRLTGRGNEAKMEEQMKKYKEEGFPPHFGMNEASTIAADLHNEKAMKLLDEWWKEFDRSQSSRDQLAWPYVLWKNDLKMEDVGCLGTNVRSNDMIEFVDHNYLK